MLLSSMLIKESSAEMEMMRKWCCSRRNGNAPGQNVPLLNKEENCVPCEMEIKAMTWNIKAGVPNQGCCFNEKPRKDGGLIRDEQNKFLTTMMNQENGVDVIFLQEPLIGGKPDGANWCAKIGTGEDYQLQLPKGWDSCSAGKSFDCSAILFRKSKFTKVGNVVSGNTGFNVGANANEPDGGWDNAQKSPERFGTACQVNVKDSDQVMNLASFNFPHDPWVQQRLYQVTGRPIYNEGWMRHLTPDMGNWQQGSWKTEKFANARYNPEFPQNLERLTSPITLFGGDFNNKAENVEWVFNNNESWKRLIGKRKVSISGNVRTCCPDSEANLGEVKFSEPFDHVGAIYNDKTYTVEIKDISTLPLSENTPQPHENFPSWQFYTNIAADDTHAKSAEHLPVRATFHISFLGKEKVERL